MGMSGGPQATSSGGRGRRRGGGKKAPVSEINVTPLVDVMLVLLIIFMVAAPLMTVGVPIDLPETQAKEMNSDTKPITISVDKAGQIFFGDEAEVAIPIDEVLPKLQAIATTGYEERIFVRGDAVADYGTVMKVMARISSAGYKNIGLVTLQETPK
ncbi:protein TolR [Rhizobium sp. KVB221]|uniref:Protein TolR n=1 Tax=Rhizobium setariae TaxID=2801340 RepID=A0A937CNW2_9HYPH|nr:protein TolR [Rhizobium setariae]MBL0372459.1 protein TolR [Rhizobium setariae]